jgi:putative membrane protein
MRALIAIPLLLLLVLFALSNPAPVRLGLWPTDLWVQVPLSLAVLGAMAVAFLLGGLFVWFNALGQRRRARRAEARVRALDQQIEGLKARLAQQAEQARQPGPALPPPA